MERIPESGRLAATVLLDALVSFSSSRGESENTEAMQTALGLLVSDDMVVAGADGEGVVVDASDLLGAAIIVTSWLAARLAEARETDIDYIAGELRLFLDTI